MILDYITQYDTSNPLTITVDKNYSVVAEFELDTILPSPEAPPPVAPPPAPVEIPDEVTPFTLNITPQQRRVVRGGAVQEYTINILRAPSFTGNVQLSVNSLSGIQQNLTEVNTVNNSVGLVVSALNNAVLGLKAITVVGESTNHRATTTAVVEVVAEPPAPVAPPPVAPPPTWRSCVDEQIKEGTPPQDYIQSDYRNGEKCWEPRFQIGFEPSLDEALQFQYRRRTTRYPEVKTFKVVNPSYVLSFELKLETNNEITLTVDGKGSSSGTVVFTLGPRSNATVGVKVTPQLLEKLADGTSTLDMNITALEL